MRNSGILFSNKIKFSDFCKKCLQRTPREQLVCIVLGCTKLSAYETYMHIFSLSYKIQYFIDVI